MKNRRLLFLLLLLATSIHFTQAQKDYFLIGVWSFSYDNAHMSYHAGINTSVGNSTEFYQLFKGYGFNTIQVEYQLMPNYGNPQYASSNPSKAFLDRADSLGMKVLLHCPDISVNQRVDSLYNQIPFYTQYDQNNSNSGLNYYGDHPALAGFAVCDEPSSVVFSDVGQYFSDIENFNPDLLRLANLLPSYGKDISFGYPGTGFVYAYPRYVEDFITATNPNILSFDYYPIWFFNTCDSCIIKDMVWPYSFYFNFDVLSRAAENHNIPLVYIPTFLSAKNYTSDTLKNVPEMRYVVYAGLMHGIKGLNYWHAGGGYYVWYTLKTETKEFLRQFHGKILAHEDILMSLHYKDSYHVNAVSTVYSTCTYCEEYIPAHMQWAAFGNDLFTQAIFDMADPIEAASGYTLDSLAVSYLYDDNGGKYFWVSNKSFKRDLQILLNLGDGCTIASVMEDEKCPQGESYGVHLLPGEAKLYRAFFGTGADTVSSSVTWNQKRVQGQNLVVDSLATLTITDTVFFTSAARLIVRPGGKLIVDGGTLTSACPGEMWQGIEVVGDRTKHQNAASQGTVILRNGAAIENAVCGIRTGLSTDNMDYLTTGGIIHASNSAFRNNRRAVDFLSYADTLSSGNIANNKSWFKDCDFILNDTNLFLSQGMQFLNHVTLWDVKGVSFEGCTFANRTTGFSLDRKRAIYAESAGFSVKTLCNSLDGCNCYGTADTNRFAGFSTAIEANSAGSPYTVAIDEAKFENNVVGVKVNACNYASVTRCLFDLSQVPHASRGAIGLRLDNSTGYLVEGNTFKAADNATAPDPTGIQVVKSMKLNNNIYRNNFKNLDWGIVASDTNGLGRTGLCFTCNTFDSCSYDIHVNSNGSIAASQGTLLKGADNEFTGTQTSSLYNNGVSQVNYYHSSSSNFILHNPTGVQTESDLALSNPCLSTLCDQGGNVTPVTNFSGLDVAAGGPGMPDLPASQGNASDTGLQAAIGNYYAAVRRIMSDSVESLQELAAWHMAAGVYADPYSLTEIAATTGNAAGVSNMAQSQAGIFSTSSQMSPWERDNYADFRFLMEALRPDGNNAAVNWPAATPAQIDELQRIAEANTGRSSTMAKGVLCFFFDICYDDVWDDDGMGGTRRGTSMPDEPSGLLVYPNPTDGTVSVESTGGVLIEIIMVYDSFGRIVATYEINDLLGTFDMHSLHGGIYLLRVQMSDGTVQTGKVMKL